MPLHLVKLRPELGEAAPPVVQTTARDNAAMPTALVDSSKPLRLSERIPWAEVAERRAKAEPEWKIALNLATRLRENRYRVEKALRLDALREWDRESAPTPEQASRPERAPRGPYLTGAQLNCLRAFAKLSLDHGRAPTRRELCGELGVSANGDTLSEHLGQLTSKGYLEEVRALTVVGRKLTPLGTKEALKHEALKPEDHRP